MMSENPLTSLHGYSLFISQTVIQKNITRSTITAWSESPYTGVAEGEIFFENGYRLRIREELDFESGLITSYGYEAYLHEERLYWYDDFPHPNDKSLTPTYPHHKHIRPDIKHHRIPAGELSFHKPNLPILIAEILKLK